LRYPVLQSINSCTCMRISERVNNIVCPSVRVSTTPLPPSDRTPSLPPVPTPPFPDHFFPTKPTRTHTTRTHIHAHTQYMRPTPGGCVHTHEHIVCPAHTDGRLALVHQAFHFLAESPALSLWSKQDTLAAWFQGLRQRLFGSVQRHSLSAYDRCGSAACAQSALGRARGTRGRARRSRGRALMHALAVSRRTMRNTQLRAAFSHAEARAPATVRSRA
jgi:hypothetical protein